MELIFFRNLNRWSDESLGEAAAEEFRENPGEDARGKGTDGGEMHLNR